MSKVLDFICSHEAAFKSQARLASLYSDFSLIKVTNPDGYSANVKSWTSALQHASREGVIANVQSTNSLLGLNLGSDLEDELYCKGIGKPAAISSVASENISQLAWIPIDEFNTAKTSVLQSNSRGSFQVPSAREIAQWGLRRFGLGSLTEKTDFTGQYVILSNAEAAAQKFRSYLSGNPASTASSRVYSLETFTETFASTLSPASDPTTLKLSQPDILIMLTYLSRDKNMIEVSSLQDPNKPITIKLPSTAQSPPEPISQNDIRIAELKTLLQTLTNQVTLLESRAEALDQAARKAISSKSNNSLAANDKSRALASLRQKRLALTTLERRQDSLNQIEDILQKIDDASSQVEIVRALENGVAVLNDLNRQVGGVERVDAVMDELQEEMANVEEVGGVIAEGGQSRIDEGEIEDELEALEAEEKRRRAQEKGDSESKAEGEESATPVQALPNAPTTDPASNDGLAKSKPEGTQPSEGEEIEKRLSMLSLDQEATRKDQANEPGLRNIHGSKPITE